VRYNVNLSAHRAAAVRAALLALLPQGSVVRLYAHGETDAFGDRANNRRVGVRITTGVPADAAQEERVPPPTFSLRMRDPLDLNLRFNMPLFPPPQIQTQPNVLLDLDLTQPDLSQIDWYELRTPFTSRGVVLDDRDIGAIQQQWTNTYNLLRGLGIPPARAAQIANLGLAHAYDTQLGLERPNLFDLSEREQEMLYPDETRTPIVPIITPEILSTVVEKLFGEEVEFRF
jgi:hypothetical protein